MITAARAIQPCSAFDDEALARAAIEAREEQLRDPAFYPQTDDRHAPLAVITAHFNWSGYRRPVLNLLRFLREMDYHGIPVYGMELHLEGTKPLMARNHRWLCLEVGSENLRACTVCGKSGASAALNIAIRANIIILRPR